ncbi:MAG: thioredoxin family protein [Actinomycetota bacterium]|nr:thioredoxin family protein [Actinomycetota bacterium]
MPWRALTNLGIEAEVEKVTDVNQIIDFGVMATPALASRWRGKVFRQNSFSAGNRKCIEK